MPLALLHGAGSLALRERSVPEDELDRCEAGSRELDIAFIWSALECTTTNVLTSLLHMMIHQPLTIERLAADGATELRFAVVRHPHTIAIGVLGARAGTPIPVAGKRHGERWWPSRNVLQMGATVKGTNVRTRRGGTVVLYATPASQRSYCLRSLTFAF